MRLITGSLVLFACLHAGWADNAKKAPSPPPPTPAVAPAKPGPINVKTATRSELETEVEQLRTENAALKKQVAELKAANDDRQKRLQQTLGGGRPATTLK